METWKEILSLDKLHTIHMIVFETNLTLVYQLICFPDNRHHTKTEILSKV